MLRSLLIMVNAFLAMLSFLKVRLVMQGWLEEILVPQGSRSEGNYLHPISKVREFQLDQIFILIDSLEIFHAIEGKDDWILKSCVADILDLVVLLPSGFDVAAHANAKFCSMLDMNY